MDEDEDVVWDGSPLHQHLLQEAAAAATSDQGGEALDSLDLVESRRPLSSNHTNRHGKYFCKPGFNFMCSFCANIFGNVLWVQNPNMWKIGDHVCRLNE